MTYVDGFLAPVHTDRETYLAFAAKAAEVFKDHGASRIVETWSDDVPHGQVTDFYRAVDAREGEAVVFSWIEWPDKATRDAGMKKVMDDSRMQGDDMPFDGKRMVYGGFAAIFDA
jgi:uncharacterized protein YbaA (DUF1428 family)